jgi:co-chaperonin GroES (HSP10)
MKTFDLFVVELEKTHNDTIVTNSGLELYISTKYDEFENRVTEGPVVAVPFKYHHGVEVGDTLYFHHHVVIDRGQPLTGEDNHYIVQYNPTYTAGNQAIGYKSAKTGLISPLAGWSLLEGVEEPKEEQSSFIEVVKLNDDPVTKGRVAFEAPWLEELGLSKGDVVGFKENRDYRISIDGKEYYRTRAEDLMYVER